VLPEGATVLDPPHEHFQELPGVHATRLVGPVELVAAYHDTPGLDLVAGQLTLRRRTGGSDEGWHLKLLLRDGARLERHEPLGDPDAGPPVSLLALARSRHRDRKVQVVVTLTTRRRTLHLLDEADRVLVEVAEDSVVAEVADPLVSEGHPGRSTWDEVEVEVVDGDEGLLVAVTELLAGGGARPAGYASKVGRALETAGARPARGPHAEATGAGAVLLQALDRHVAAVVEGDPMVRLDRPDAVHGVRVATRRLRSLLAAFRPLLDGTRTEPLRAELRWLGGVLGGPRDAEVLTARLHGHLSGGTAASLSTLPDGLALEVDHGDASTGAAVEALDSARYLRLLAELDRLLADPPMTGRRTRRRGSRDAVGRAYRRVVRDLDTVPDDGPEREEALHEVRKSTKRLRYTCEAVAPVLGRDARRLAGRAEDLQELLGEHQDSVVAQQVLARATERVRAEGGDRFELGRLTGLEQAAAEHALEGLDRATRRLRSAARRVLP